MALVALVVFGLGSIACAMAPSSIVFIAARVVVGLAGAALIVMALSLVTVLFSETERPRAIGLWSAANFVALPLGPILGGWILSNAWWGWIFLMNVPVVAIALVAVIRLVPESRAPEAPGVDKVGVAALERRSRGPHVRHRAGGRERLEQRRARSCRPSPASSC